MPPKKRRSSRSRSHSRGRSRSHSPGPSARSSKAASPPQSALGLLWVPKMVVMSHTAFFFGDDSLLVGLAGMLTFALGPGGWLLLCSVVAAIAAVGSAWSWGCERSSIEAGAATCNAPLVGGLIALVSESSASPWAVLEAAALTSALTTVLGLQAGKALGGFPVLGSFPGLVVITAYKACQASWHDPLLPLPYPELNLLEAFEPFIAPIQTHVVTPFEAAADELLASGPVAAVPGLGAVVEGVGSFSFAPAAIAIPLTLTWLLLANPSVPFGVWTGCAAGLAGEALMTAAIAVAAGGGGAEAVPPSSAGLNGSLAFVVVYYFYFGTQLMVKGRRTWRAFVVAATVAGAAGAGTCVMPGTWPSSLVLIAAQLVDKLAVGLWSVAKKKKTA